jgi:hypothetical protein
MHEREFGLDGHVALWIGLLVVSVVVWLAPGVPVAVASPLVAVAVASLAAAVGLALLQLGIVRFAILGRPMDLIAGLGFGTLAVSNLVVRILGPPRRRTDGAADERVPPAWVPRI